MAEWWMSWETIEGGILARLRHSKTCRAMRWLQQLAIQSSSRPHWKALQAWQVSKITAAETLNKSASRQQIL